MTRLEMAPSVQNWNSIARFLMKNDILYRLDKDAFGANYLAHDNPFNLKFSENDI